MSLLWGAVGLMVGAVIGHRLAARGWASRVEQLRQARRVREDESRALRLQLRGLRRAYETGSLSVDVAPDRSEDRITAVLEEVRSMVAPFAAQAGRQAALTELSPRFIHRGHLSALLAEIAARAGLETVVLSDGVGLPLADAGAADGASGCDALAAASAMILSLSDRLDDSGQPTMRGAVIRDAAGRTLLYRIFEVAEERYVLTGVTDDASVAPDALDPTLPQLRHILRRPTAAVA